MSKSMMDQFTTIWLAAWVKKNKNRVKDEGWTGFDTATHATTDYQAEGHGPRTFSRGNIRGMYKTLQIPWPHPAGGYHSSNVTKVRARAQLGAFFLRENGSLDGRWTSEAQAQLVADINVLLKSLGFEQGQDLERQYDAYLRGIRATR